MGNNLEDVRRFIDYWYESNGGTEDGGVLELALLKYLSQRVVMFFENDHSNRPLDRQRLLAVLLEVLLNQDEKLSGEKSSR